MVTRVDPAPAGHEGADAVARLGRSTDPGHSVDAMDPARPPVLDTAWRLDRGGPTMKSGTEKRT